MMSQKLLAICFFAAGAMAIANAQADDFHAYATRMVGGTWTRIEPADQKSEHAYRWCLGQRFMLFTNKTDNSVAVIGDDPASGKRTWWVFRADGVVSQVLSTSTETAPNQIQGTISSPDGKNSGTIKTKYVGADRLEVTADATIGGAPIPPKQVWKRTDDDETPTVSGDAPKTVPAGLMSFTKINANAVVDGRGIDGDEFRGVVRSDWILGGKFHRHILAYVNDKSVTGVYMAIIGMDPDTGKPTGWEWDSDGGAGKFVLTENGQSLTGNVTRANGDSMAYEGSFTVSDEDKVTYTATGKIGAEEAKPYHVNYRTPPTN